MAEAMKERAIPRPAKAAGPALVIRTAYDPKVKRVQSTICELLEGGKFKPASDPYPTKALAMAALYDRQHGAGKLKEKQAARDAAAKEAKAALLAAKTDDQKAAAFAQARKAGI